MAVKSGIQNWVFGEIEGRQKGNYIHCHVFAFGLSVLQNENVFTQKILQMKRTS